MAFNLYVLSREVNINRLHIRLVMSVCCVSKAAECLLLIDGRITPLNANPLRFWEVDTPAKAEAFINRINLDALVQGATT